MWCKTNVTCHWGFSKCYRCSRLERMREICIGEEVRRLPTMLYGDWDDLELCGELGDNFLMVIGYFIE